MFLSKNRLSVHLWWKENLVKHWKISEYYKTDGLKNFPLLFIFFINNYFFQNSHIKARILFIFLKNILKQTGIRFNTKFQAPLKDRKSSNHVREILGFFDLLIALPLISG